MAETDANDGPWFATAGIKRGAVKGIQVEHSATAAERSSLTEDNRINPIVDYSGQGLRIYGNRTTLRDDDSDLKDVHVRRMMLYIQKVTATTVAYLVFDPNDPVTWRSFRNRVEPILERVKRARGLDDFRVICDETTNPLSQRIRREMRGTILVRPLYAAETINMDFGLASSGADFTVYTGNAA
jgi:phage tail sheath protein FI